MAVLLRCAVVSSGRRAAFLESTLTGDGDGATPLAVKRLMGSLRRAGDSSGRMAAVCGDVYVYSLSSTSRHDADREDVLLPFEGHGQVLWQSRRSMWLRPRQRRGGAQAEART